jgi:hypothetical protein
MGERAWALPSVVSAMIRVALAIRARGDGSTRLSRDDLERLFTHPKLVPARTVKPRRTTLLGEPGKFWSSRRSSYYWLEPIESPEEYLRFLQEFSLLRFDGHNHGLLHDSMIDYFQGVALREYEGYGQPGQLSHRWAGEVVARVLSDIRKHRHSLEFLGGALQPDELDLLLEELLSLRVVPPDLPALIERLTKGAAASSPVAETLNRITKEPAGNNFPVS